MLTYNINPGYAITWNGDWRLPTTVDGLFVEGFDGTTTGGWKVTNSEMGHLYFTELGNLAQRDTSGNLQAGGGLTNTGDFQNLLPNVYWSGTEYATNTDFAWYFRFDGGRQDVSSKLNLTNFFALAVRDGDVAPVSDPIPEPPTWTLLGIGLIGIAVVSIRKKLSLNKRGVL